MLPGGLALALLLWCVGAFAGEAADATERLRHADSVKTANYAEFSKILAEVGEKSAELSSWQQQYLRYLKAWQIAYVGDYEGALTVFKAIIDESGDLTLSFRAGATAVNVLTFAKRYEEAFSFQNRLIDQLPQVTDQDAREQGLVVAAILYNQVGQHTLAMNYAEKLEKENWAGRGACKGGALRLQALYKSGQLQPDSDEFRAGIEACVKLGELVHANAIRTYVARLLIDQRRADEAITLMLANFDEVQRTRYPRLISEVDAVLAQAYWQAHDVAHAQQSAHRAIENSAREEFTEPLVDAYRVLYVAAKDQGDQHTALSYLEKYMAADKGYLDDVSAGRLAYQMAQHQAVANRLQIDALHKQNQVLQLQQALGDKAVENGRLYIALLISILAFIVFWAYKTKRSQLHFMKLARRDGLTGIFNRHHFISAAEHALEYCKKSGRHACVVIIDLDHFKLVNDEHGHATGDLVLKRTVAACQAHLRSIDIFGRLGGEEFGIMLPECDPENAKQEAERIRAAIAALSKSERSIDFPVSASFGITSTEWSDYDLRQLLAHADAALYHAKRAGRNRVELFDPQTADTAAA